MVAQWPLLLKDFEILTASVKRGKLDFKYSGEPAVRRIFSLVVVVVVVTVLILARVLTVGCDSVSSDSTDNSVEI